MRPGIAAAGRSVIDGCVPIVAGPELEAPAAGDRREEQRDLHHRERGTDALPRPEAERDERRPRQALLEPVEPALRAEGVRLREETRVAMRRVHRDQDDVALRDRHSADRRVANRLAARDVGRRVESKGLVDDGLRVGQGRHMLSGTRARPRGPLLSSVSSRSRASGSWSSSRNAQLSASAVVSCPASSSVITSSRIWRSDMPAPCSSRASCNIESRSPRSSPGCARG